MIPLAQRRCFNHPNRQAAIRCPSCARHFCHECATEHHHRYLCAACLAEATAGETARRGRLARLRSAAAFCVAIAVLWFSFYTLGAALLAIPSQFHQDTAVLHPSEGSE